MLPMSRAKAEAFWRGTFASAERGERIALAAEDATGAIVGTVQVIWAQPENQPHRGDVAEDAGASASASARGGCRAARGRRAQRSERGKTLLVLDTVTDRRRHRLYARHGWQHCGEIPDYALRPDGRRVRRRSSSSSCAATERVATRHHRRSALGGRRARAGRRGTPLIMKPSWTSFCIRHSARRPAR